MSKVKITVANKKLVEKPTTEEMPVYFSGLKFKTGTFPISTFRDIVENGYTITYVFKDHEFQRKGGYMKENYLGTQFIVVDVDKCDIPPQDLISRIKYKPTIYHTTFSNLTERKENKYCFHLIYVFDQMIYGEDNFHSLFNMITDDYKEYVDEQARDCHRVMFTSNSVIPNYEYEEYDIIYRVSDFIKERYDNLNDFFNQDNQGNKKDYCKNNGSSHNNNNNYSIYDETIFLQEDKDIPNTFNLNEDFRNDLFTMDRIEFFRKYEKIYPYRTETHVEKSMYVDGYADLRNQEYYIVPSARYKWDTVENKPYIPKVKIGFRSRVFLIDTLTFMKIFPNILKEHLVYLMVREIFHHFDNSDGQFKLGYIIKSIQEIWNKRNEFNISPLKKSFKIDKDYWREHGYNNWIVVSNMIRKKLRSNDFGELYDLGMTVEQNVEMFKEYGIITTKRTLVKWCKANGIPYVLNKDRRNEKVLEIYKEDKKRSSREIQKLCAEQGVVVSHATINTIITGYEISYNKRGNYTGTTGLGAISTTVRRKEHRKNHQYNMGWQYSRIS